MRKAGYTQSAIASCFGCSGSTISREVRHNLGRRGYRHNQADEMTDQRIFESRKRRKFTLRLKWQLRVTCESKRSDEVMIAMIFAFGPFIGKTHSITVDNGKEFAGHETVNSVPGIPTYFAHPDSSWEHGLNENTNGLTREYLKKGDSLKGLTL